MTSRKKPDASKGLTVANRVRFHGFAGASKGMNNYDRAYGWR
jgi:hypothetical protein